MPLWKIKSCRGEREKVRIAPFKHFAFNVTPFWFWGLSLSIIGVTILSNDLFISCFARPWVMKGIEVTARWVGPVPVPGVNTRHILSRFDLRAPLLVFLLCLSLLIRIYSFIFFLFPSLFSPLSLLHRRGCKQVIFASMSDTDMQ